MIPGTRACCCYSLQPSPTLSLWPGPGKDSPASRQRLNCQQYSEPPLQLGIFSHLCLFCPTEQVSKSLSPQTQGQSQLPRPGLLLPLLILSTGPAHLLPLSWLTVLPSPDSCNRHEIKYTHSWGLSALHLWSPRGNGMSARGRLHRWNSLTVSLF